MTHSHEKIIIIGAGAAGYTAAIYAARANLSPLFLLDCNLVGNLQLLLMLKIIPDFQT